ncbi:spermatogenesis-associated protein 4 isoform X1 [Acipenser oxyrinchus oxyrinchus]|uniref:Spermatogenesis-associated protein 4 n=1 Tax=Acipenser oxyrinchus oxyrinchus TaxID=40147 RepID=A0AAD8LUS4_ACIOX|nr:spermatogenesis-associated protein 4 isoform X1 [Acipenser oxyrinchus oxyrinchus]
MSYMHTPKKSGIPREVLKWLQSLDLSFAPKNARRDFSNGYLVAEIFSWYYPEDFPMDFYDNGVSLQTKFGNWSQIEKFLSKRNINLHKEVIDGTIHCKPGAAEILVREIYTILTNRKIKTTHEEETDFTDRNYQDMLPMVARATASKSIKNNLRITELMSEPDTNTNKQKIHAIIHMHLQQRQFERAENPKRFDIKPTLGELAVRLPPASLQCQNLDPETNRPKLNGEIKCLAKPSPSEIRSKSNVQFKEIDVRQTNKNALLSTAGVSSQIKGIYS